MTYIVEKPTVNNTGTEPTLVTIEFYCKHPIKHSKFTLCERVIVTNHFPEQVYTVRGIEICISETPSGKLLSPPRWKYKVTDADKNSFWKEESALERYKDTPSAKVKGKREQRKKEKKQIDFPCTFVPLYLDPTPEGFGWCNFFNRSAKTDHKKTNDCILNGALDKSNEAFPTEVIELDRDGYLMEEAIPDTQYQLRSKVKVIDPDEDYTEWGTFEVIKCEHYQSFFHNQESDLNQAQWHYQLASFGKKNHSFWVSENEICDSEHAHNVCTKDIF